MLRILKIQLKFIYLHLTVNKMIKTTLSILIALLCTQLYAQKSLTKQYSPEESQAVIKKTYENLKLYHAGLYRYTPKEDFDKYVDSLEASVKEPITELELYRKMKPMVSKTRCLHTDLITAASYDGSLDRDPNLLPFQVFLDQGHVYVVKSFENVPSVFPNDEILTINKKSIDQILQKILSAIPSDGYNQTMKNLAIYHQFPSWYRSMVEVTTDFEVTVIRNHMPLTVKVKGAKFSELSKPGFLKPFENKQQLDFTITNKTGILVIRSFSKSDIKAGKQKFKEFMDDVFVRLKDEKTKNLIIDLRYNTGGSDPNAAYLSRYFFNEPFRYWDRIEVAEGTAKSIKGISAILYRKPIQKDGVWLWQKGKLTDEFDFTDLMQPHENNFKGNVYLLINGFCMSSCADFAAILSKNKKVKTVGEETGGGFQGNNSGIMPGLNLRPTGLVLTVPLQKYYNAVDLSKNFGRGIIPDYPIEFTVEDLISGKDKAMIKTMNLIKDSSN